MCNTNKWLLSLIIFAPALIGFIILGVRIYLDRRELKQHTVEMDNLNVRHIVT